MIYVGFLFAERTEKKLEDHPCQNLSNEGMKR